MPTTDDVLDAYVLGAKVERDVSGEACIELEEENERLRELLAMTAAALSDACGFERPNEWSIGPAKAIKIDELLTRDAEELGD